VADRLTSRGTGCGNDAVRRLADAVLIGLPVLNSQAGSYLVALLETPAVGRDSSDRFAIRAADNKKKEVAAVASS
jgi:hypothetical protein